MRPQKVGLVHVKPALRAAASLSVISLLAACASHTPTPYAGLTATQEAAIYRSHAKADYTPPGPPGDPWRPYIQEASARFDVPDTWIREVMHVESGGYQFRANGALTTSPVGAMGLMQLMPDTYDEVRARYGLSDDAFDPHNNILAGAAYMREMYDAFGSPGFLAAYNAGPARLQDYLVHNRPLPDETRRYVYMIGTRIEGTWPQNRSPNEQLAVNQIPVNIPAGPRWVVHHVMLARNERHRHEMRVRYADARHHGRGAAPVEVAEAPEPRSTHGVPQVRLAMSTGHGMHYVSPAVATVHTGGKRWGVQLAPSGGRHVQEAHVSATRVHYSPAAHAVTHAAVHACAHSSHHKGAC